MNQPIVNQRVELPGVQKPVPGSAYQKRQGDTFSHLKTNPEDWAICPYQVFVVDGLGMIQWDKPGGYIQVSTRFGSGDTGDGEWTTCQLCGARIKHDYYILHHEKKYMMRVGCECFDNYEGALTPDQRVQWSMAKRARVNPHEVVRVQRVVAEKGWTVEQALVAVRAWNRAEKAFEKKFPSPGKDKDAEFREVKKVYWSIRNAGGMRDLGAKRQAWGYWKKHRPFEYAAPVHKSLEEGRAELRKSYIADTVNRALKKRGYKG